MNLSYTSLHHIDHHSQEIEQIAIVEQNDNLREYINQLMEEITSTGSKRSFEFRSDHTEIRGSIKMFLEGQYVEASEINASRLLSVELKAQAQIRQLGVDIQKGSLFQAVLSNEDSTMIIISKADHNKFMDEDDFSLRKGLPWDKRVFKAFLVLLDSVGDPSEIYVFDTTKKVAKYWWDRYLELEEKYTDEYNTKQSLGALDSKIFNTIKRKYPADHTILRNSTIGYFRNEEDFDLNEYVDRMMRGYNPVAVDFPLDKVIERTLDLPNKWNFDSQFPIEKKAINKRVVEDKIPLTEDMELLLKDHIKNLSGKVSSYKDAEGNKFIQIKSDIGYERFKTADQ